MTAARRIAVVSTPRSGNTWVRQLIGQTFQLPQLARHSIAADEWAGLPAECVLQIHWRPEPEFVDALARHGFRVLTLARHPLDTLLSILHVAVFDVESERWLDGTGGNEESLYGAWPTSRAFIDYCRSPRAAALLAVSTEWAARADAVPLRYEQFVADPVAQLRALEPVLGSPRADVVTVVERCSLGELRKHSVNNHFWKGQPGLWRELLPAAAACEIGWAIRPALDGLKYALDPNPDLTLAVADRNWQQLTGAELGVTLRKNTAGHLAQLRAADERVKAADERADAAAAERDVIRAQAAADVRAAQAAADAARHNRDELHTTLAECLFDLSDAKEQLAEAVARAVRAEEAAGWAEQRAEAALSDRAERDVLRRELATVTAEVRRLEAVAIDVTDRLAAESLERSDREHDLAAARLALAEMERTTAALERAGADARRELAAARTERDAARTEQGAVRQELSAARRETDKVRDLLAASTRELAQYRGLQRFSLKWAWRVQRLRNKFPWATAVMKRTVGG